MKTSALLAVSCFAAAAMCASAQAAAPVETIQVAVKPASVMAAIQAQTGGNAARLDALMNAAPSQIAQLEAAGLIDNAALIDREAKPVDDVALYAMTLSPLYDLADVKLAQAADAAQ